MLLWQEEGWGSLGMLQKGKLRQALNPLQKYRIFDTFPAAGKGGFYLFSLSLAYNETQRQGQTLDSSPSCLHHPFSPSNVYSPCNKQTNTGFLAAFICVLFSPVLTPFLTKLFTKSSLSFPDTVTTNPEEQRLCQRPCQENAAPEPNHPCSGSQKSWGFWR